MNRLLPQIIEVIRENDMNVLWMCDPLHGNTQLDQFGKKYRLLRHVVDETIVTNSVLRKYGANLSGFHLEISPLDDILECVSQLDELTEDRKYESALDPRLNRSQCNTYLRNVLQEIC